MKGERGMLASEGERERERERERKYGDNKGLYDEYSTQ